MDPIILRESQVSGSCETDIGREDGGGAGGGEGQYLFTTASVSRLANCLGVLFIRGECSLAGKKLATAQWALTFFPISFIVQQIQPMKVSKSRSIYQFANDRPACLIYGPTGPITCCSIEGAGFEIWMQVLFPIWFRQCRRGDRHAHCTGAPMQFCVINYNAHMRSTQLGYASMHDANSNDIARVLDN